MKKLIVGLTVVAVLVPIASVWACSIPVFRYALERWSLAPYEVVVFHRGSLSGEDKALLKKWTEPKPRANIIVTSVNVEGKVPGDYQKMWDGQKDRATLPWLITRPVMGEEKGPPLWAGPFNHDNLKNLLDSPARQQLVKSLSQGDSGVFLLLSSDDPQADEAAKKLLEKELAKLAKSIELPEQTPDGPQLRTKLPLRVRFAVVPVSRRATAEKTFVHLLLNTEEDLAKAKGPIVFPIFGRGRLLCALHGQDISDKQLFNVVRFLCGACSCQVKELNPGLDLPITADWTEMLFGGVEPPPDSPRLIRPKKK